MYQVNCTLTGISPISFSAPVQDKKKPSESHDSFEERTWRQRLHVNKSGDVFIPPMALKNCLSEMAKYVGESVPGKGKSTYTKHFDAGVSVIEPIVLGVKGATVDSERLFVPSDGKKGGGSRVWKNFPYIVEWSGQASIIVIDPILKPEKVQEYLKLAGQFIGLGRFRPRNGGFYGRFTVSDFKTENLLQAA